MGFPLKLASFAIALSGAGILHAGTISYVPLNSDSATGINTANQSTYSHLLDFGADTGVATINGVAFTKANTTGTGFTYAVSTGTANAYSTTTAYTGAGATGSTGLNALLQDMIYDGNNSPGGTATLTLTGLATNTNYETRLYVRSFGSDTGITAANTRTSTISFNGDGTPVSAGTINEDDASTVPGAGFASSQVYAISYDFNSGASTTESITFTEANTNLSWHIYGVTNQAVPEPATAGFLAVAAIGLLSRRRKFV